MTKEAAECREIAYAASQGAVRPEDGNMLFYRGSRAIRMVGAAAIALLMATALRAAAQTPPTEPAKPAPAMEEEVIVTGHRDGEPDFQEQQEYHAKEYRRLKELYDPDPLPAIRSDRLVRMPEVVSSTVQGKPTLTERQW